MATPAFVDRRAPRDDGHRQSRFGAAPVFAPIRIPRVTAPKFVAGAAVAVDHSGAPGAASLRAAGRAGARAVVDQAATEML